jgi:hypothetical protein
VSLRDWFRLESGPIAQPQARPPSARERLVGQLLSEIADLRSERDKERARHELVEAELRAQLVALANSNALAMASYYGPARPTPAGAAGVRRVLPPDGYTPTRPSLATDEPLAERPWDQSLFGGDHLNLGERFTEAPDGVSVAAAAVQNEDDVADAMIERLAKEREAARLGSTAPPRRGQMDEEG